MRATEAACLLELKRFVDSGLTLEEAVQHAVAYNQRIAAACHRLRRFDLEAVARKRIKWYTEKGAQ